jgi:hypothetical protein
MFVDRVLYTVEEDLITVFNHLVLFSWANVEAVLYEIFYSTPVSCVSV